MGQDKVRIYNFTNDFLDDSGVSDGSFWEKIKTLEDQAAITNRLSKRRNFFFLSKSMHEPTDNNSNTISATSTVPSQTIQLCVQTTTQIFLCEGYE